MNPLFDDTCMLQKYPGKGGWIYAELPTIAPSKSNIFGWVQVKGFIDSFELKQYKLMPLGNGNLFLPVKASTRKIINKTVGDVVKVILYLDNSTVELPEDLKACLLDEPAAYTFFKTLKQSEQKTYIDWINAAKLVDTRAFRIVRAIDNLLKKNSFTSLKNNA